MSVWGAVINGAASLAGVAATGASNGKLNKKNRQWQEDRMREQNEYNSPTQQMHRLRQAGINPHLAYSQGSISNSSAGVGTPPQTATDYSGIGDAAQNYIATRMQQKQMQSIDKSMEVQDAEKSLKEAQEIATLSGAAKTDQELLEMQQLLQLKIDQSKANIDQTTVNTQLAGKQIEKVLQDVESSKTGQKLSEAQIANLSQQIRESAQRIKVLQIDGKGKEIDNEIKKLQETMWKQGINPNSSALDQIIKTVWDLTGMGPASGGVKSKFKKTEKTYDINVPSLKDWFTK